MCCALKVRLSTGKAHVGNYAPAVYHPGMAKSRIVYLALIIILAGCNLAPARIVAPTPTAIDVPIVRLQSTPVSTLDRQLQALPSPTPELSEPSPTPVCPIPEGRSIACYTVIVDMDYAEHAAAVQQTIRYTNMTGESLLQIVLIIEVSCLRPERPPHDGQPAGTVAAGMHGTA